MRDALQAGAVGAGATGSPACGHDRLPGGIRNIYVQVGDIVDTVSIERQRFVVLELKASEESNAAGRIVVAPSGAYAYSFKGPSNGTVGHSEGEVGKMFCPLAIMDEFKSFGWPPKDD